MHCKYLGVDQYFYGSVLKVLVFTSMEGEPANNMDKIMAVLREYFQKYKVPNAYRHISVSMWNNKDAPKLKGRAAELRHLGSALRYAFQKFMLQDPFHKKILATLKLNIELEVLLDQETGWNFQGAAYNALCKAGHDFMCGYNACQAAASRQGLELFTVTIKGHHVLHALRRANWIHPKAVWCFGGEAFMKISKKLHASCANGNAPHKATVKAANQFLRAIHLQWTGASQAQLL